MSLPSRIPSQEIITLRNILSAAFVEQEFDDFLLGQFGIHTAKVLGNGPLNFVIRDAITYFNNRALIPDLLMNARLVRPYDPDLLAFIERHNGNPKLPGNTPPASQLERTIREANSMLDVRGWTTRLATIQNQVCRVEISINDQPKPLFGTGFLIAPDVVITNYHVVECLINGIARPIDVGLRFDFVLLEDGVTPNPGTVYKLAANWLIDSSPYSLLDSEEHPLTDPQPYELDYALLRLDSKAGEGKIATLRNNMETFQARGWIKIPSSAYTFNPQSALFIVQHPEGTELKLAFDMDSIISLNGNGTRVRYKTNTQRGSSGSPCFDANWNLVALHHAGDPNYSQKALYNQGIPFMKIVELLEQRDKVSILDS